MLPLPLVLASTPVPAVIAAVQEAVVMIDGSVSCTRAAVAVLGPALVTVIV